MITKLIIPGSSHGFTSVFTWLNQPSGSEIATEHAFAFCLPGIGQSKQIGTDKAEWEGVGTFRDSRHMASPCKMIRDSRKT